jgi:hypothetical protein
MSGVSEWVLASIARVCAGLAVAKKVSASELLEDTPPGAATGAS